MRWPRKPLLDAADAALTRRAAANGQTEAIEVNLDAAEKLWQAGKADCKPAIAANDPLQLVLAKTAQ